MNQLTNLKLYNLATETNKAYLRGVTTTLYIATFMPNLVLTTLTHDGIIAQQTYLYMIWREEDVYWNDGIIMMKHAIEDREDVDEITWWLIFSQL